MRLPNGQQPVQSAQVTSAGDSNIAIFITDGRSLTVGAQPDIVQAVQDEVDGRGNVPGGLVAAGVTAIVRAATIHVVHVTCTLILSRTGPDSLIAQRQAVQAITDTLARAPVGHVVGYMDMLRALDEAIPALLRIDFSAPTAWSITPQVDIPVMVGTKLMPGTISVEVQRG
jgi:hypothetical protein